MLFSSKFKHYFFNAFRELFVHHHGSLEFRAKLFTLIIAANENIKEENYLLVKQLGLKIYNDDEDRANLLLLSTKELLKKLGDNNGLNIDKLISQIQKDLKFVPRYAKKIDIESLEQFLSLPSEPDTISYQKNILEFLQTLKDEILLTNQQQIDEAEKRLHPKH